MADPEEPQESPYLQTALDLDPRLTITRAMLIRLADAGSSTSGAVTALAVAIHDLESRVTLGEDFPDLGGDGVGVDS